MVSTANTPAAADEGQGGPVAGAEVGDNQEGDKEDGGGAESRSYRPDRPGTRR